MPCTRLHCFEFENNTIPIWGYGSAWLTDTITDYPDHVALVHPKNYERHPLILPQESTLSAGTQLIHQLFYFLDEAKYPQLVELFKLQCIWKRQGELLTSHAQILQALSKRPATQRIRHVISNTFLSTSAPTTATLTAYMTAYRFDNGIQTVGAVTINRPFRLSVVHAKLEAIHDQWRVAELDLVPEFEFAIDSPPVGANQP